MSANNENWTHVIWFAHSPQGAPMKATIETYSNSVTNLIASQVWDRLESIGMHMLNLRPLNKE